MGKRHPHTNTPQEWLSHVAESRDEKTVALLEQALEFYTENMPPREKGLGIADTLLTLGLDSETLAAGLLYPGLQAHLFHLDTITDRFGEGSRRLLRDVLQMQSLNKLQQLGQQAQGHPQLENLRKMLLAMATDVRSVLIILAERLWQLHQIKNNNPDEQKKFAHETLNVYAPLANRLGFWQLKWEIEDLCLRYLESDIYHKIAKSLVSRRQVREEYMQHMINLLTTRLHEAGLHHVEVNGRVKHIYSIYRKMVRKSSDFTEIYDITALRVLVDTVDDCYTVLSILQNHWEQIPEEFDDYITHPKPNGYRSIHTVIIGPENHFVEIQIRTHEMHKESESGGAAHWIYKEGVLQAAGYEAKIALLRQIMAWQKEVASSEAGRQDKPIQDLFADRIYVFTPTGDIIDLSQGATPLDFAYHIHSEVGHRCRGAKVNGKIVPLTYRLQTGDRVEVLTTKKATPSRDWLNPHLGYLKTSRALAKLHHYFRMIDSAANTINGRELLEKELKKSGLSTKVDLDAVTEKFKYKNSEDLLVAIAMGDIRVAQVIHYLFPEHAPAAPTITPRAGDAKSKSNLKILGVDNVLTNMARCCKPLPGDAVIGYITRNRGVSIHRRDCSNIKNAIKENQRRLVEVAWGDKQVGSYPVDLKLRVDSSTHILRDISGSLANEKINILSLQTQKVLHSTEVYIYLSIELTSVQQLKRALELLQKLPNVLEVQRW